MTTLAPPLATPVADVHRVQRRTLAVLALTQAAGGAGVSTAAAVGGLTAARLSGSATVGGLALTAGALGAALTGLPLARAAQRFGRRTGLRRGYLIATLGAGTAAVAVGVRSWPLLLAASVLLGTANATTLAARFAATDLARPEQRGRALSVVLWATTIGAVTGPNLAAPAGRLATALGAGAAAGPYLLCTALFGAAALGVHAGLRPDPLLVARTRPATQATAAARSGGRQAWPLATAAIVVAQAVMVGLMAMAPLHLAHGGADLRVVGLTISAHVGAMYALSPLFGWLSDRVGRLPVLGLGAGLLTGAAVVGATATPHAVLQLTCGLVLLGTGWSAVLVSGSALLVDAVPAGERPRAQGRTDALMNLSGAAGGAASGGIVAATSYPTLCAAATALPALVLVAVVRELRRRR
jgi:MFS family permease